MFAHRRGFSLVELLVAIGIVAVLLALTVPAVQKVRETANRLLCASHLRQLTTAAHLFHNDHGRFPPGYLGPSHANATSYPACLYEGQWIGHFPLLLPYLEQQGLFKQLQVDFNLDVVTTLPWFWKPGPVAHDENYRVAMTPLKFFRCPSAPDYEVQPGSDPGSGGTALGLHVFNSEIWGAFTCGWKDDYTRSANYRYLARTNYMGVAGIGAGSHSVFRLYQGIYTNRSAQTLGEVAALDGTGNTLLYGELSGTHWHSPVGSKDICWMAGGGLGTYRGLQRGATAVLVSFSSWHPGGVQFCFADGSVRIVRFGDTVRRDSPDWLLLQQLAGFKDGQRPDASALLD